MTSATTDALPAETTLPPTPLKTPPGRLTSIDAYRGLVMFLMVAEALNFGKVSRLIPDSGFWQFLASQQSHRDWVGCSLHDLIQPSFTFLVGVALPFSIASRVAKGQSFIQMLGHAVWRSFLLIALGIFLRSTGSSQTNFTFEDTLTQIGLGYTFAFLIAFARPRAHWLALGVILIGYWAAWALYPLPPADFDWKSVGVRPDWVHLTGFAQHWDKNWNLGTAFDQWFLNLFPRKNPFVYNGGGYLTLSFIPTLGTMLFGLIAGRWLRSERTPREKIQVMLIAGAICFAASAVLHFSGINPVVKRIWTPAWTIFSAGWCFLFLAAFYAIIDVKNYKAWAFPLVVIGMNSIAIYCLSHLIDGFILKTFQIHFGQDVFRAFGEAYATLFSGTVLILVLWLILFWMYRRKLFLRV
jgi:heparan-alpha-glucosaminide N-acetyltransferase